MENIHLVWSTGYNPFKIALAISRLKDTVAYSLHGCVTPDNLIFTAHSICIEECVNPFAN